MSSKRGAWGIEVGQAALKALRLEYNENTEQVVATGFDYIPHPKILSQPDAIPEDLIAQALELFLSRNKTHGDAIAISVPGQQALTRFVQLPPVDASKIKDIVKFEAKQQIPFELDEVIWDYQTFGSTDVESGFMLDAEVGLFAMKRDLIEQNLSPFTEQNVEIDLIQTIPLTLYNFMNFDLLGLREGEEPGDESDHVLLLDMGVDNTTLIVTNGSKIWTRNVPIGGNHFTRALTKEMKLTFAKAEHLKCNATRSPDPRAVFQALRPVFNNYVAEIQRSIGFFSSVNRDAQITRVVGVGNGFRMAGLQKFLQQNLSNQFSVERLDSFNELAGDGVITEPLFTENVLSFAPAYGMAIQLLQKSRITTNLIPPEIITSRTIRQKKPWALVTAALLMIACMLSTALGARAFNVVNNEEFKQGIEKSNQFKSTKRNSETAYKELVTKNEEMSKKADKFIAFLESRELWLDLYKGINECLPVDDQDPNLVEIHQRKQIRLTSITATKQSASELNGWFRNLADDAETGKAKFDPTIYFSEEDRTAPTQNGYLIKLGGIFYYHDENDPLKGQYENYLKSTLLANLQKFQLDNSARTPIRQQGISHATIAGIEYQEIPFNPDENKLNTTEFLNTPEINLNQNPDAQQPDQVEEDDDRPGRGLRGGIRLRRRRPGANGTGQAAAVEEQNMIKENRFDIEFVWTPTPLEKRYATEAEHKEAVAKLKPPEPTKKPANNQPVEDSGNYFSRGNRGRD